MSSIDDKATESRTDWLLNKPPIFICLVLAFSCAVVFLLINKVFGKEGEAIEHIIVSTTSHALVALFIYFVGMAVFKGFENHQKQKDNDELSNRIADRVKSEILPNISSTCNKFDDLLSRVDLEPQGNPFVDRHFLGVRRIHPVLNWEAFFGNVKSGCDIDILNVWIPAFDGIRDSLRKSLESGYRVRILLVHPNDQYVAVRSTMIGDQVKLRVCQSVRSLRALYQDLSQSARENLHVRLYRGAPPCTLYRAGDHSVMGLYGARSLAIHGIQFEFQSESAIGSLLNAQFMLLWDCYKSAEKNADIDLSLDIDPSDY